MIVVTNSETETKLLGKKLASHLKGGEILLLIGNLGSGKTTFVKGIGKGLGIKKNVRSPSFTLMNQYKILNNKKIQLFIHLDCYRLQSPQEVVDLGFFDYLGKPKTLIAIEWPEKIKKLLKNNKANKIKFVHLRDDKRKITLS